MQLNFLPVYLIPLLTSEHRTVEPVSRMDLRALSATAEASGDGPCSPFSAARPKFHIVPANPWPCRLCSNAEGRSFHHSITSPMQVVG